MRVIHREFKTNKSKYTMIGFDFVPCSDWRRFLSKNYNITDDEFEELNQDERMKIECEYQKG